ncbi:MAG: dephospho-CoA kinase [Bacteroidaceae bacterium]|nr:dephospho-CoA kinase [Bacteroidaceae bacterium]
MTRIGITGGIGSGKSYLCQLLQRRGIPVYHCDDEAKRLMVESPVIRKKLSQLIGDNIYINNVLNKPVIAQYLFANSSNAAKVNGIVHPVVKQDFLDWAARQDAPIVAQECALLFETGFQDTVDKTIEVYAPHSIRLQRAILRDHATVEEIEARMAQQMDEEEKRQRADYCIINDGTTDLHAQIDQLLHTLEEENTPIIPITQNN